MHRKESGEPAASNPLKSLLQGLSPRAPQQKRTGGALYSGPTSPTTSSRAPKQTPTRRSTAGAATSSRRAKTAAVAAKPRYGVIPGLGLPVAGSKVQRQLGFGREQQFSQLEHSIFGAKSASAPASPARPAAPQGLSSSAAAQLQFAALRLSSPRGSPQQTPAEQQQQHRQQEEGEEGVQGPSPPPISPLASASPAAEEEEPNPGQPGPDGTPLGATPHRSWHQSWGARAGVPVSPLPELSPMQISPLPPAAAASQQQRDRQAGSWALSGLPATADEADSPCGMEQPMSEDGSSPQEVGQPGPTYALQALCSPALGDATNHTGRSTPCRQQLGSTPAGAACPPCQAGSPADHQPQPPAAAPAAGGGASCSAEVRMEEAACAPTLPAAPEQGDAMPPQQRRRSVLGSAEGGLLQPLPEREESGRRSRLVLSPRQPAKQPEPASQPPAQQQSLPQRRAAEDRVVDATCPPLLCDVLRHFPLQKEAFVFADRCNRSQPLQRQPSVLMSRLAALPCPSDSTGSGSAAGRPAASGGQQTGGSSRGAPGTGAAARSSAAAGGEEGSAIAAGALPGAPPQAGPGVGRPAAFPAVGASYNTTYSHVAAPRADAMASEQAKQEYRSLLRAFRAADGSAQGHPVPDLAGPSGAQQQQQQWEQQQPQQLAPQEQQLQQQQQPQPGVQQAAEPAGLGGSAAAGASAPRVAVQPPAAEGQVAPLHEEPVRVFCLERQGRNGVFYRQFVAATYPAVWREYRHTPMARRHWYEVIREGRPCHLYFDLECPVAHNPGLDMDGMVNCLLHHVDEALGQHYGLAVDYFNVYELDSSTEAKHSRHLLLRLPGHAFSNNHAMGKFVAQVLAAAGQELMVVQGVEDGVWDHGCLVDTAVYSRNRHFRMAWSCKGGKAAVLVPTRRFATADGCDKSTADVFLDTLICRVDPDDVLLQMPDPIAPRPVGGAGPAAGGGSSSGELGPGGVRLSWKHDVYDAAAGPEQAAELRAAAERAVPFIEQVASQRAGGLPARARTLAFCGYQGTVAYSMLGPGSHYCENIGRCHKSNFVFFVVNFSAGLFAQKCHDPNCCHYRSAWMPLPPELCLQWRQEGEEPQPGGPEGSRSSGGGGTRS